MISNLAAELLTGRYEEEKWKRYTGLYFTGMTGPGSKIDLKSVTFKRGCKNPAGHRYRNLCVDLRLNRRGWKKVAVCYKARAQVL